MSRAVSRRAFNFGMLAPFVPAFGQNCAPPTGGPAVPFSVPSGQTNIQRKAISALSSNEITRLRLAYQKLRDLTTSDPQDPRGWMQQANVHCFLCGGNPNGSDIHQSWSFFPWHRAYLYYHERILGNLIGDPTFRLPYWDWDMTASRNLPAPHRSQNDDSGHPNSLFDRTRAVNDGSSMPGFIFPVNNNPMNAPNFASFGGSAGSGGALENGPHGLIHVWTCSKDLSQSNPDMGILSTAARDPIFFAHHCNIDRLWSEWLRRNTVAHQNPTSASWLNLSWTFFDEQKKLRRIRARDVTDTAGNLGYNYPPGAGLADEKREITRVPLLVDPRTKAIKLPKLVQQQLQAETLNQDRSVIVENAALPEQTGLYFVFAGEPPAAGGDASTAPNYLGYIGLIKGEHAHAHHRPGTVVFKLTKTFTDMASSAQGAQLILRPSKGGAGSRLDFTSVYMTKEKA